MKLLVLQQHTEKNNYYNKFTTCGIISKHHCARTVCKTLMMPVLKFINAEGEFYEFISSFAEVVSQVLISALVFLTCVCVWFYSRIVTVAMTDGVPFEVSVAII